MKHAATTAWWRSAVIYQVYPQSFADANGDGIGDLPGITGRLDHLASLGVDAVWLSPFYTSPMIDGGYDVADYRDVNPMFGTLGDFDALLARAHDLNLKVIVDIVPNHTSSAHPWFIEALKSPAGSDARERYIFRNGTGSQGSTPPNDWQSVFGGPAWTRVADGQWYLHLFDSSQPDLNWLNDEVRAEFASILRFWLDRGVDGFRIDVAHGMIKAEGLPDVGFTEQAGLIGRETLPYFDQDGVHEIYREWRAILDSYPGSEPPSPKPGPPGRNGQLGMSPPANSTKRSTSTIYSRIGPPVICETSSTRLSQPATRWVLPPPGSCPIMTSHVT